MFKFVLFICQVLFLAISNSKLIEETLSTSPLSSNNNDLYQNKTMQAGLIVNVG